MSQELIAAGAEQTAPVPFPMPRMADYQTKEGLIYSVSLFFSTSEKSVGHTATLSGNGVSGHDITASLPDELYDYTVLYQDEDGGFYSLAEERAKEVADEAFYSLQENIKQGGSF